MRRFARSPEPDSNARRIVAGGFTALAVTFAFVAANAIWYQPHAHQSPIFATRHTGPTQTDTASVPAGTSDEDRAAGDQTVTTIIRLENEAPAADSNPPAAARSPATTANTPPSVEGDPLVAEVQTIMADLGLYEGAIDGLNGPRTRGAIEAYQKTIGLEVSRQIDETLLEKLGIAGEAGVPTPPPRPGREAPDEMRTASLTIETDPMVLRIQAGLKAFGNDGIEVDGMVGPRTRAAIKEFQSLFGLPVTGEPGEELYVKMREIGLAD